MQPIENFKRQERAMTNVEQLDLWVEGHAIHNTAGECCPDFSCCTGKIADKEVRERFRKAFLEHDDKVFMEILTFFLSEHLSEEFNTNVIVITDTDGDGHAIH